MNTSKSSQPVLWTAALAGIIIMVGCSAATIHDHTYVSNSIKERTGNSLKPPDSAEGMVLPDNISMEDGLTMDEAVSIALWNNPQFQADIVELGFARADLVEAGLLRNPVLSLLFPLGPKQLEFTLNLAADILWQRPKRIEAAKANAASVADNLIQHGLNLTRDVMVGYADLELARRRADILARESAVYQEIASISAERLKVGDISGLEDAAVHMLSTEKKEASINAARNAGLAEERLKALLGILSSDLEIKTVPSSPDPELSLDLQKILNNAFAARPDLRAAELSVESAGFMIGWEKSKIFNLMALLDANGEGKEGFEIGPGFQFEIPLFNQNNGKILRARAVLERAARQYLVVKEKIAQEVREAYTNFNAANESLNILRSGMLAKAKAASHDAGEAYRIGHISYLELLDFQSRLHAAQLREADAEAASQKALAELRHGMGFRPLDQE